MSRHQTIEKIITQHLNPAVLFIEDESYKHQVPDDAETHFNVTVVSAQFASLTPVKRHQLIYNLLVAELNSGLHALSLHLYTPQEWQTGQRQLSATPSPACRNSYQQDN